jgi:hypothetical protein
MADEEVSAGFEMTADPVEHKFLRRAAEVDQDVAAEGYIEPRWKPVSFIHEIQLLEHHAFAQRRHDSDHARFPVPAAQEIFSSQFQGNRIR